MQTPFSFSLAISLNNATKAERQYRLFWPYNYCLFVGVRDRSHNNNNKKRRNEKSLEPKMESFHSIACCKRWMSRQWRLYPRCHVHRCNILATWSVANSCKTIFIRSAAAYASDQQTRRAKYDITLHRLLCPTCSLCSVRSTTHWINHWLCIHTYRRQLCYLFCATLEMNV